MEFDYFSIFFIVITIMHKHLSMKEGSLFWFCSYEIHLIGMLQIMFLVSLESYQQGGVHVLGSMVLDLRCKSSWILNIFFIEN
jgi:hypothetical protein